MSTRKKKSTSSKAVKATAKQLRTVAKKLTSDAKSHTLRTTKASAKSLKRKQEKPSSKTQSNRSSSRTPQIIKTSRGAQKATAKQLRKVADETRAKVTKNRLSVPKKHTSKILTKKDQPKPSSRTPQIIKTSRAAQKAAKTITKIFRDAFGRFAKAPKRQPSKKSKSTKATGKKQASTAKQKKQTSFARPKKTPVKLAPRKGRTSVKYTAADERRALAESSKKKPTPKRIKKQEKSFTLRALHPRKSESLIEYFDRIEDNADEYDKLKSKDDFWVFTYANGKSRKVYRNIELGIQQMRRYDLTKQIVGRDAEEEADLDYQIEQDLLESIDFMKFEGRPLDYVIPNEERIRVRAAERQRIRREAKKVLGNETAPDFGGNIDLVQQLLERVKELEASNAAKGQAKGKGSSRIGSSKKGATNAANKKPAKKQAIPKTNSKTGKKRVR